MKNFNPEEFSERLQYASPLLLEKLDLFRDYIRKVINPSKAKGALARFEGSATSQHYAVGRLSTAVDVFVDAPPAWVFYKALEFGWNGVGVYFDTHNNEGKKQIMFHFDTRVVNTSWYRNENKYHWVTHNPEELDKLFRGLVNHG